MNFSKIDLTKEGEPRKQQLLLESLFIKFITNKFEGFSEGVNCNIFPERIVLKSSKDSDSGNVDISINYNGIFPQGRGINTAMSLNDNSPENKPQYWRTIHSAIILQNWESFFEIAEQYCKWTSQLRIETKKQNQQP